MLAQDNPLIEGEHCKQQPEVKEQDEIPANFARCALLQTMRLRRPCACRRRYVGCLIRHRPQFPSGESFYCTAGAAGTAAAALVFLLLFRFCRCGRLDRRGRRPHRVQASIEERRAGLGEIRGAVADGAFLDVVPAGVVPLAGKGFLVTQEGRHVGIVLGQPLDGVRGPGHRLLGLVASLGDRGGVSRVPRRRGPTGRRGSSGNRPP